MTPGRAESRTRPGTRWLLAIGLMLVLCAGPAAPVRAAATFFVRTDGSDSLCNGTANAPATSQPSCAFATIQAAVGNSSTGDTITVAAGTYAGAVNVNKQLNLRGAQAEVDARTRSGASETIVANTISLFGNGVLLDGFTIQGAVGPAVYIPAFAAGHVVTNNIIKNNVYGLYLNNNGVLPSLVEQNAFISNTLPGPASGNGIYSDAGLQNAIVDSNIFTGHTNAAIALVGAAQSGVFISNNQLVDDSSIILRNTSDSLIAGNISANPQDAAIVLGGGNEFVEIRGNTIADGAASAVELVEQGAGLNSGIDIVGNSLLGNQYGIRSTGNTIGAPGLTAHFNRIVGSTVAGAANQANASWNAENNWWGCSYGPGNPGPGCASAPNGIAGTGGIDVAPWLVLEASATPTTIFTGGSSAVTAKLTSNSDGTDTAQDGNLPNGTMVAFAAELGSIAPPSASTNSGQALATFTAGGVAGTGSATAIVDSQTVTVALTIEPSGSAPSTISLASSANPSVFGQPVSLIATMSPVPPGTAVPTGTVTFKEGATTLGAAVVTAVGQATFSTSALGVGEHSITAFYSGNELFDASDTTTSPLTQTVQKANTVTTITLRTPSQSRPGQAVLVHFTVTPSPPGSGSPAGAVIVSDGSAMCTGSVAAGNCSITLGAAGARTLTATYAGDTNFNASSGSVSHRVALS
ncbi:MAG TPA: Ig-like domain repeat protein, partial [Roseiflexaceae bacterium]|nr:Ig-like domain repeat protein [Roseiflexaceae bacterium]